VPAQRYGRLLPKPMRADDLAAILARWDPNSRRRAGEETTMQTPAPPPVDGPGPAGRRGAAIDAHVFDAFVSTVVGPDDDARSQLIDTYLSDAGPRLSALRAGWDLGDIEVVANAAHGLRSGSAVFGALRLAELLQQLEALARAGRGELGDLVADVEKEYLDVVVTLERLRQGERTMTG